MKQGLPWSPCCHHSLSIASRPSLPFPMRRTRRFIAVSENIEPAETEQLTARERRQLRNENRASKTSNWRENVEDMLLNQPKNKKVHWKDKINLDTLADLGPQWWMVKISRPSENLKILADALTRSYPANSFQILTATIQSKRRLKNGSISIKSKPLYPGYIFLRCVLNRELHDFMRRIPGIWGFLGFMAGNARVQVLKPKPIPIDQVEAVIQRVKDEQEEADKAFEEEEQKEKMKNSDKVSIVTDSGSDDVTKPVADSKPKRRLRKKSNLVGKNEEFPTRGSTVRIISGTFAEFSGSVKSLNRKTGKATIGITVFGKESLVGVDINEIVAVTS